VCLFFAEKHCLYLGPIIFVDISEAKHPDLAKLELFSLTNKHRESSLPEFYSSLDVTKLKDLRYSVLQVSCVFGSTTCICEQTFFIMNVNKNK
jgi:hypothetical protein